jgi:bifunctional UDP-N-acetylglucosamine pyrophosphorylase / glucosamine-1-phosphate N-acetyltransferase
VTATAAIVLAAGQGTRMRSRLPKVLHPLAGRPMVEHVLDLLARAGIERRVVVVGHGASVVERALDGRAVTVRQEPQLGTADAVRAGLARVPSEARHVVVTMGDAPLLQPELVQALLREQAEGTAAIALLSTRMPDPTGYGRILRAPDGRLRAIVEEADADDEARATDEINVGTYCFDAGWLRANIGRVPASPGGEYYLTELIAQAVSAGRRVAVVEAPDPELALGINDRMALARGEERMRRQIAERHMRNGVTIVDPLTTRIDAAVEIGQDARIEPWTILEGATVVGQDAVIGPNTHLRASRIGPRTRVWASIVEEASVAEDCEIGPYTHLRPGAEVGARCRIGNFAEIKKSRIGAGTQQHHFSYVGDAEVGEAVNIGAGSITANFDGQRKHRTVIGDRASIGVDTMMVAPVVIGEGAITGAGSVVNRDVAPGKKVVGVPARPIELRRRRSAASAAADGTPPAGGTPDTSLAPGARLPSGSERNP